MRRDARLERQLARLGDARVALGGGSVATARSHDLARAPATREIVGRRLGTHRQIPADVGIRAKLLAVAVARVDLDQTLALRVVLGTRQLVVEPRAGRCVDPPRQTVGDHERIEPPLTQLLEQHRGSVRVLPTVRRQSLRVDASLTIPKSPARSSVAHTRIVSPDSGKK